MKEELMILIDREKALSHPFANGKYDHKNANRDFIRGFESYKEWLEDLPTITIDTKPKWIPCEERLPEDGECVLAWAGGSVDVVRFEMGISQETREKMKKGEIPDPIEYVWCLADGYKPHKRSDSYCRSDEGWNNQKPYCWVHAPMEYFGQDVKAWMPLPEPYVGERRSNEHNTERD